MNSGERKVRDPATGQFAFDNNFERMCKCGHPPDDYPESKGRKCEKFRPKRTK